MDGGTFRRGIFLLVPLATLVVPHCSLQSEELLTKKTAKYLGWQTAKDQFTTCRKEILKIAEGDKVEETGNKCPEPPGPGPITGRIQILSTDTFVLATDAGKQVTLFYPALSQKKVRDHLEALKQNDSRVLVYSPADGRADSVTVAK